MTVIHKAAKDWKVDPNFVDYEGTRRGGFDWSSAPDLCADMGPGGACNIAYAAVDRHQEGPAAARTALRFVSALDTDGAVATRDMSYGELGRLSRQFTNVLRSLGIGRGDRVFTLMGRTPPELYVSIMGALRNGSVVSPLFSAFGPEPIATRLDIGECNVLITTKAIYPKKLAKIRDQLSSVRYIIVVDDTVNNDEARGTLNFWQLMEGADDNAPPSSRPLPTIQPCFTSPAAPPAPRRAPCMSTVPCRCTTSQVCTPLISTLTTSIGAQPIPAG